MQAQFLLKFGSMKKRNSQFLLVWSLLSVLVISSCKDEPDPPLPDPSSFELQFVANWGSDPLVRDQYYAAPDGRNYMIQVFKSFVSNLKLIKPDESRVLVEDVALIDLYKPSSFVISGEVPSGSYVGIQFSLGLDSIQNHTDPSDYPVEHPMSSVTSMYWTWFTNYIFAKVEGIADSTSTDTIRPFLYHPGLDSLRQDLEFRGLDLVIAAEETEKMTLTIDLQQVIFGANDTIDVKIDNFTHTTDDPVLAGRVMRNLKAAIR
jgi:hypothetical protein